MQQLLQIHHISTIAKSCRKFTVSEVFITYNNSSASRRTFHVIHILLRQQHMTRLHDSVDSRLRFPTFNLCNAGYRAVKQPCLYMAMGSPTAGPGAAQPRAAKHILVYLEPRDLSSHPKAKNFALFLLSKL